MEDQIISINLRRLMVVRVVAIMGESGVILGATYGLGMPLPLSPLLSLVAIHLLLNILTCWRVQQPGRVAPAEFLFQLSLDVAVLVSMLYFSGGATNPFISLLLLPLVVAAAVLPRFYVWGMAVVVVAGYSGLMLTYRPLPHVMMGNGRDFDWHVTGMWFGFLFGVAMIMFFVLRLAESIRERDRVLARAREQALRDEQLVALGTLAAGAAHELGTPLSTMLMLSREMEQEYEKDETLANRLGLMRQQVGRCKETLSMISASAGQLRAEGGCAMPLDQFMLHVIDEWQSMRPNVVFDYQGHGAKPIPLVVAEQGLRQALISFLNNAADSSPTKVEMQAKWSRNQLVVDICDRGPGIPEDLKAIWGRVPLTTKAEGHGLGAFLAHAVINRLDGEVEARPREGGGACIHVTLPLARLLIEEVGADA